MQTDGQWSGSKAADDSGGIAANAATFWACSTLLRVRVMAGALAIRLGWLAFVLFAGVQGRGIGSLAAVEPHPAAAGTRQLPSAVPTR